MRYGHFDDEAREYVITRPDTPLPWINYLGSEAYFGIISNTAGGYSFYRDARLRRLTRYRYNNAPLDLGGRYVYLRDDESGEFWSPSWQPTQRDLEDYSCRHGLGYTIIGSRYQGHPGRDPVLRAARREPRGLAGPGHQRAASRRPGSLSSARSSSASGMPTTTPPTSSATTPSARSRSRTASSTTRPSTASGATTSPSSPARSRSPGFDTQRDAFLGPYRGWDRPIVVEQGRTTNSDRARLAADGLAPRQARAGARRDAEVIFVLGYQENPKDDKFDPPGSQTINKKRVKPIIARYLQPAAVEEAFTDLRDYWTRTARHPAGPDRQRARRPDGQHLERLPVHGDVQHVALGLVVRVGHRPRHGLPRLEPGPARLRPHGPGARPRAHPRHRRHAAADRRRLPPVPAADQARQQRRSAAASTTTRPGWSWPWPPTSRRPATRHPGRAGARTTTPPGTETPLYEHLQRSHRATPSTGSGPTACR